MKANQPTTDAPAASPARRAAYLAWRVVRIPLIAYVVIVVIMMFLERSLLYPAPRYPVGNWAPSQFTPEEVELTSADGTKIHGWYFEHPQPRATILYLHGNGENVAHVGPLADYLRGDMRANVLAIDYRGYGKSEGKPYEQGLIDDGRAARAWLAERAGLAESEIVLMGRSLGGGVAVALAAELPARGLVLESTNSSLPETAGYHYPWLPVKLLMRNRFNSLERIASYEGPLLQSHSQHDEIVPYAFGAALFEAAPGENKKLLTFSGLGHNDPQPQEYYLELDAFLEALPPEARE